VAESYDLVVVGVGCTGWRGAMAVRNALLPAATRGIRNMLPLTTFADTDVARVRLTEQQARQQLEYAVTICE
jgi:pyruvate/2-oxoglutarate dehydrogenase complex dihydrolipoamide dehydrogenase (E3) component